MLFLLYLTISFMLCLTQGTCSINHVRDNMVARRLEGNWTFNGAFSNRLSLDGIKYAAPVGQFLVSYTNDPTVLDAIPADNCGFLEKNGIEIYLAGTLQFVHLELGGRSQPYVLTSRDGVPAIIYWQGVNAVTNFLQVAPAILPENDLLFLGEGSVDKPFSVLERVGTSLSFCEGEDN